MPQPCRLHRGNPRACSRVNQLENSTDLRPERMTRAEGLGRMRDFIPRAARYAALRNFDFGPGRRDNVSRLSAHIRHRLITEEEVAHAVLAEQGYDAAEKFLQEIAWRTYWKGWLEMRPQVWSRWLAQVDALGTVEGIDAATGGTTGIDCFDAWVAELKQTGYLHNHARMWFASIWIFTLRLPWQAGADFMFRHLLDGDPASNTLSWRWVAGLHTPGKHYLARASNIARYTEGRFDPRGQLDESAPPLPPDDDYPCGTLDLPAEHNPAGRIGHLMLADDLAPPPGQVVASAGWHPESAVELPPVVSPLVHAARAAAVDDAVERTGGTRLTGDLGAALRTWIANERLDAVWLARPTVGPWRDLILGLPADLPLVEFVRPWDRALWPHATAGFFRLRKMLPGFYRGSLFAPA